jgi:polyferredoxin
LLRETAEGEIENAYTLKLMNLSEVPRDFIVRVAGMPGVRIVGEERFTAEPGSIRPVSVTVAAPSDSSLSGIQPMLFSIQAADDRSIEVVEKSSFILP